MSHANSKKVKITTGKDDKQIAEMFNQMLGTGEINMTIAYPRYTRIKDYCEKLTKLFELIAESPFMKHPVYADTREDILKFCAGGRIRIRDVFCMDFSNYEWNLTTVEEELQKRFVTNYAEAKKCDLINTFIVMLKNLAPYKNYFLDLDKLQPRFITGMSGTEWRPFPFTELNLKAIFSDPDVKANTRTCFMTLLCKSFEFSEKLYTELTSPDIDVKQFAELIINSIESLQKRPELQRCDKAFAKIKESIALLETNFNKYYQDFVGTNDGTIIMQNFIIDVSMTTNADATIKAQFKRIIAYYSKLAREQPQTESTKLLFSRVEAAFSKVDRRPDVDVVIQAVPEMIPDSEPICLFDGSAKTMSDVTTMDSSKSQRKGMTGKSTGPRAKGRAGANNTSGRVSKPSANEQTNNTPTK